jgi:hypothetical protein
MGEVKDHSIFSKRANPSRQYMMGKLFDYQQRLLLFENSHDPDKKQDDAGQQAAEDAMGLKTPKRSIIIKTCRNYLEAIEETVTSKGFLWKKKSFTAWHLIHRFDETLFLLMSIPELKAQAWEMLQGLKQSSLPQQAKTDWSSRIDACLKKLDEKCAGESERAEMAYLLNSAVYVYNDFVDNLFWDIWCKKFIALIHTSFLIVLLGALMLFCFLNQGLSICLVTVLLLGAMGGLGSGILTFQPVGIAYGHFWSVTFYHTLVRPLQGAIAALMTFWMLQGQYLIAIEPPLKPGTKIVSCAKGIPCELPVVIETTKVTTKNGIFCMASSATFAKISTAKSLNQTITLKAAEGMQIYLYLLVLLIAGFSGDKVLKTVTDKVSNKLFAEAEKTKDGK